MSNGKALLSLLIGSIFTILGGTATLSNLGINLINLPFFLYDPTVTKFSLLIGGLLLLIDSFSIKSFQTFMPEIGTILIGILLAIIGAVPLLLEYNLLNWLPFIIKFTIPAIVLSGILAFFGLYLMWSAVRLFRTAAMFGH